METSKEKTFHPINKGMTAYLESVGSDVVACTRDKISDVQSNESIWYPYGPMHFGGHYSKTQISSMLENVDLRELGKKGLKLRMTVAGIAIGILYGIHLIPGKTPEIKTPQITHPIKDTPKQTTN